MDNSQGKCRNSNFEMLRIISILMILFHHFSLNYGINLNEKNIVAFFDFLYIGGQIGVNCFVLITGYFMIKTKIKIKNIFLIITQTTIFSIILYFITIFFGEQQFSLIGFLAAIFPVLFNTYWYVTTYVGLYFLIPFINKLIRCMSKRSFEILLIFLLIKDSLLPTIACNYLTSNLSRFVMLYCIGAYIRCYLDYQNEKVQKKYKYYALIGYISLFFIVLCFELLSMKMPFLLSHKYYFTAGNKIVAVIISMLIFLSFKESKIKFNKIINTIGSTTFGIYIFHAGYGEMIIWKHFLHANSFNYSNLFYSFLFIFSSVAIMFILGLISDLIYKRVIYHFTNKLNFEHLNEKINI